MTTTNELFAELDDILDRELMIKTEHLSDVFRDKVRARSLGSIKRTLDGKKPKSVDPRSTRGSKERLRYIEMYAQYAEQELEIPYDINEDMQHIAMLKFVAVGIEMQIWQVKDFEDEV